MLIRSDLALSKGWISNTVGLGDVSGTPETVPAIRTPPGPLEMLDVRLSDRSDCLDGNAGNAAGSGGVDRVPAAEVVFFILLIDSSKVSPMTTIEWPFNFRHLTAVIVDLINFFRRSFGGGRSEKTDFGDGTGSDWSCSEGGRVRRNSA